MEDSIQTFGHGTVKHRCNKMAELDLAASVTGFAVQKDY